MTKVQEFIDFVGRLSYKPGCSFRAVVSNHGAGVVLFAFFEGIPDSRDPSRTTQLIQQRYVDAHEIDYGEKLWLWLIDDLTTQMELHERDEWLKLDGKCIKDAHPSV